MSESKESKVYHGSTSEGETHLKNVRSGVHVRTYPQKYVHIKYEGVFPTGPGVKMSPELNDILETFLYLRDRESCIEPSLVYLGSTKERGCLPRSGTFEPKFVNAYRTVLISARTSPVFNRGHDTSIPSSSRTRVSAAVIQHGYTSGESDSTDDRCKKNSTYSNDRVKEVKVDILHVPDDSHNATRCSQTLLIRFRVVCEGEIEVYYRRICEAVVGEIRVFVFGRCRI